MRSSDRHWVFMTLGSALVPASQAAAHPGHGLGGGSYHWLHYLTEPLHVAPFAIGAVAVVLLARARRSVRRPTR